ncbi:MAG: [FeFe] hydrogenase H-cluster radical SAM maturase HydE [Bacteroidota bacterium]
METARAIARLAAGKDLADADLRALVELEEPAGIARLLAAADETRRRTVGDAVHLRGLIEFSNYCRADCLYCGLRRSNGRLVRYRLSLEEIEAVIDRAAALDYGTVVLQSGEDPWYDADAIARLIRYAKARSLAVTLSVGERDREELAHWRRQGADRYLLRHETANPTLHARLRPGRTLVERVRVLENVRELGFQVGSGFMVGLPGQSSADLVGDLRLLQELKVEMAGIGPFIPHPATPLAGAEAGSMGQTLKMVALARLLLPEAMLPAVTALGALEPLGREQALQAGANVVMPNLTPTAVRPHYQIYPGKICLGETAEKCRACVERRIQGLGRTVARGPGHAPGWDYRRLPQFSQEGEAHDD